jgi:hypothetical protein
LNYISPIWWKKFVYKRYIELYLLKFKNFIYFSICRTKNPEVVDRSGKVRRHGTFTKKGRLVHSRVFTKFLDPDQAKDLHKIISSTEFKKVNSINTPIHWANKTHFKLSSLAASGKV